MGLAVELKELIGRFSDNAGIEKVAAKEGVWKFSADGNVFGVMQDDAGARVYLFGEIPAADPERKEALLKAAMEANYFHRGTGGATFALSPASGALTLFDSKRLEGLDEAAFYAFVERFVNALATWNGLAGLAQGAADAAPADDAPGDYSGALPLGGLMRV